MCGTLGLFADCPIADTCAIKALAWSAPQAEPDEFRSPFEPWYERSAVRSAPARVLDPVDRTQVMFSPDLVPVLQDTRVRSLGSEVVRAASIRQALRYLEFTAVLEARVVNDVVRDIMFLGAGVTLPPVMVRDAHRIYTDEAFHAQFSYELAAQITNLTGVAHDRTVEPYFVRRLRAVKAANEPSLRKLIDYLFVFVSETLITGSLSTAAQDSRVAPAVSESLRDHARDEGRHHVYFAEFFRRLWGALPGSVRVAVAPVIPDLIDAFLAPDVTMAREELKLYGFTADEANNIADGIAADAARGGRRAESARLTLQYVRESDADLTSPQALTRFEEMGMGRE
ncbi:hypothetical protein C5D30_09810 [Rathayibacter toxicus]|uniref:Diiron oxygenase n=1 Tax=Rathayibacter toxicus TaxID=145458 RepID=A0A2S5Y5F6_9MICO|nr:hypothetical protein C5D15_09855 [Rathayibacter toxicus]PPG45875.1 hypothetical protein C5D16_09820 [Rathayibacter toxicus]PPH56246.1 hypothetical protein C5D30_09810 [Rathayibacter toxicus]PPH71847.1 hypothetical protein C5D24_09780 [Rathayibacter toxicus]PPI13973.1 hypothetical protein C5C51_09795 [Rathayibacter toxicus]